MINVSVVIPTKDRATLLARCLFALQQQTLDEERFEVIVCDDGPSKQTKIAALEAARKAKMKIRYVPVVVGHGPAAARNAGWRLAQGDIIAFTDDDCIPHPDWLQSGLEKLNQEGLTAVMGRVVVPLGDQPTDYERDASFLQYAEFPTANSFYRRDALEAVGGFDERFKLAWREDADLFFKVLEKFGKMGKSERAVVLHPIRKSSWGVSLFQQKKALYNALLYKKHPRLYRTRIQPHAPLLYYGILSGWVMGAAGSVLNRPEMVLAGAFIWVLLTAVFLQKRLRNNSSNFSHVAEMIVTSVLIPPVAVFWRIAGAFRFRTLFF